MARTFWNGQYRHTFTVAFEFISNREDAVDISGAQKRRALVKKSLDLEGSGGTGVAYLFHRAFKKIKTEKVMLQSEIEEGDEDGPDQG